MTLEEAKKIIESRSSNINLQWFVISKNNGYYICSSSYVRRFPDTVIVHKTGDIDINWKLVWDDSLNRFKHVTQKTQNL